MKIMETSEQEFVELKISVKIPREVCNFLRDFYALSGETVEEVVAGDCENIVVDWALDEVRGLERKPRIIEKYGLKELFEKHDC